MIGGDWGSLVSAVCGIFELLLHGYAHIIHQSHLSSPLSPIHAQSVMHQMLATPSTSCPTRYPRPPTHLSQIQHPIILQAAEEAEFQAGSRHAAQLG